MGKVDLTVSGRDAAAILVQLIEKHPELRVGQILVVATKTIDIFNLGNEELAVKLNEYLWGEEPSKSG